MAGTITVSPTKSGELQPYRSLSPATLTPIATKDKLEVPSLPSLLKVEDLPDAIVKKSIPGEKCGLKLESGHYVEHKDDEPRILVDALDHDACLSDTCDECSVEHNQQGTLVNNKNLLIRLTNEAFR